VASNWQCIARIDENTDVAESLMLSQDNVNRHSKLNMDIISGSVLMLCSKQILSTPIKVFWDIIHTYWIIVILHPYTQNWLVRIITKQIRNQHDRLTSSWRDYSDHINEWDVDEDARSDQEHPWWRCVIRRSNDNTNTHASERQHWRHHVVCDCLLHWHAGAQQHREVTCTFQWMNAHRSLRNRQVYGCNLPRV